MGAIGIDSVVRRSMSQLGSTLSTLRYMLDWYTAKVAIREDEGVDCDVSKSKRKALRVAIEVVEKYRLCRHNEITITKLMEWAGY